MSVNDGGAFKVRDGFILVLLLLTPAAALYRASDLTGFKFVGGYEVLISGITYLVYAADKRSARSDARREPEKTLHLLELIGGWPGAFVAQRHLHHKSAKRSYQIFFWLIVALHQCIALDGLRGWPVTRELLHAFVKR